jgi:uncharacterized protein (TIGR02246 family)
MNAPFTGPAEDRQAIRELIDAYSDAVFRHDADAWIACWAPDAVWKIPGIDVSGAAAIRAAWEGAMSAFSLAAFFAQPGAIRIDGDLAEARVYTQEILIGKDGSRRRIIGAYDDRLVRRDGAWLFAGRTYRILDAQT